jgi:hypothetical protein
MTEIEPGLWQGSAVAAVPPGIDCLVNLAEGHEPGFRLPPGAFVRLMLAPIQDGPYRGDAWLASTVDTVLQWRAEGLSVLVCCQAGLSRSSLVMAAVLMTAHQWTAAQALTFLVARRPQANPNAAFRRALADYVPRAPVCIRPPVAPTVSPDDFQEPPLCRRLPD